LKGLFKDYIYEYSSPLLEKPLREFSINCPLHYFSFDNFKNTLLNSGYELIHPEGVYYNRIDQDLLYTEGVRTPPFTLDILSTLDFKQVENIFYRTFREQYQDRHILIEGLKSVRIHDSLNTQNFDKIRHTLPENIINVLENSLWNFEEFCNRFKGKNISPTLGILLYGPPGVGKTFVLRSYFEKMLHERNFTIVQIYQECLNYINMSVLLSSCRALFPSRSAAQISRSPDLDETNAMCAPSGENAGSLSQRVEERNGAGAPARFPAGSS